MGANLERVAKLAEQLKLTPICEYETFLAAALAACAREAKLEQAEESEQALLAARKFVRGRHSVLTFGPRVLLEQLDLALLRITKLKLEVSGERAVGEKAAPEGNSRA